MNTSVSAAGARALPTQAARSKSARQRAQVFERERAQRLEAIRGQHENWFVPTPIYHTDEGTKQRRKEAWWVRTLVSKTLVLKRTLVIDDKPTRLLLQHYQDRTSIPDLHIKPMVEGTKRFDLSKFLEGVDAELRRALKKLLDHVDQQRENLRAEQVTIHMDDALLELPEPHATSNHALPAGDEMQKLEPKDAEEQLGIVPRSQLHDKRVLRGKLVTWEPYRSQDVGGEIDGLEQWFVSVETTNGPRHLVGEDFHRAFLASGALKGDLIRIAKRNAKDEPAVVDVIEERHGSHGDGEHPSTHTRKDVYDVFIEKSAGSARRQTLTQPQIPSAPQAAMTSASQPEALREINLQGRVAREALKHMNDRPIVGWTIFRVKGQDAVHLRLLSLAPDDHVLLIVCGQECMDRYVYREPLETSRRRVSLRLPDLVIRPAGPPAVQVAS